MSEVTIEADLEGISRYVRKVALPSAEIEARRGWNPIKRIRAALTARFWRQFLANQSEVNQ